MDALDEYLLEELLSEKFPHNRLPTTEECLEAIQYPEIANPLIKEYLRKRPSYRHFLEQCLGLE